MQTYTITTENAEGQPAYITVHAAPGVLVEHIPAEQPMPEPEPLSPVINVVVRRQRIRLRWGYGSGLVHPRLPSGSVLVVDQHVAELIDRDSPGVIEVIDPQVEERYEPLPRLPGMVEKRVAWAEYMAYTPRGQRAELTPAREVHE